MIDLIRKQELLSTTTNYPTSLTLGGQNGVFQEKNVATEEAVYWAYLQFTFGGNFDTQIVNW